MKWMSKAEIFKLPFMGWMMRMAGDIPVHRDSAASRRQAFADARDRLGRKVSVMMMPEGTRSRTLDMLPFKDGAFRVAIEMGCPVVPVAIAGTRHAMAAGSFVFNRATAEARVLEPIDTAGMTAADVPRLRDEVRERIRIARDALRAELGLPGASPAA
jgi:1-acyl-sn-glycerol-3-phosphate acyltransferase